MKEKQTDRQTNQHRWIRNTEVVQMTHKFSWFHLCTGKSTDRKLKDQMNRKSTCSYTHINRHTFLDSRERRNLSGKIILYDLHSLVFSIHTDSLFTGGDAFCCGQIRGLVIAPHYATKHIPFVHARAVVIVICFVDSFGGMSSPSNSPSRREQTPPPL